uniref:Formamidopyrimidine-DNA glycosylase catalytic domain-containing protein n=1 Tax=Fibrocapsa japonica TaxID=94617 RepID=A0A7S2UZQ4_9STRA|mmetsp:Transcript_2182/g.3230  ORF Transcript_2182/g.3230 Transcript_2182/m.3230 type:complete len:526 (+) Transcript_2182:88-1665(+)
MPELPEVDSAGKFVWKNCKGQRVVDVCPNEQGGGPREGLFDEIIMGEGLDAENITKAMLGRRLQAVGRRGKQLWFTFSEKPTEKSKKKKEDAAESCSSHVLFHLGMTGSFRIQGKDGVCYVRLKPEDKTVWPPRFCKLELVFENGVRVAFCDPRRLGRIKLRSNPLESPPISLLARDPVEDPPTLAQFQDRLKELSAPVKAALLDQSKIVSGVGNWIADEVCFQARVHPATRCNDLTEEMSARLHSSLLDICKFAVDVEADYHQFPDSWLFHYRWGKGNKTNSKMPNGDKIEFSEVGGRTTAVVPAVQGKPLKAVGSTKSTKAKAAKSSGGKNAEKAALKAKSSESNGKASRKRKTTEKQEDEKPTSGTDGKHQTRRKLQKKGGAKKVENTPEDPPDKPNTNKPSIKPKPKKVKAASKKSKLEPNKLEFSESDTHLNSKPAASEPEKSGHVRQTPSEPSGENKLHSPQPFRLEDFKKGAKLQVKFDDSWYPGIIAFRRKNTIKIFYEDGSMEVCTVPDKDVILVA